MGPLLLSSFSCPSTATAMAVSIQKVVILLSESKDWDDWYEVIRGTAVRKGVFHLIDVSKETASTALSKPVRPTLTSAKAGATSFSELNASEQSYYKILLDEHKDNVREFEQQEKALNEIYALISDTLARPLRTYTRDLDSPHDILRALRKRLEPTSFARKADLSKEYQALKQVDKHTNVDSWLMKWETTYTAAVKVNLPDIQGQQPIWDFLTAVKGIDKTWGISTASSIQMRLMDEPEKEYDVLKVIEQYRNNIRYTKATSKATPTASFATFQGSSPDSAAPLNTTAKSASSTATIGSSKSPPTCVCGVPHWFADCPYLIESKRPAGWVADKDVQAKVDEKSRNPKLKSHIERIKRREAKRTSESQDEAEKTPNSPKAAFATSAVFTVDRDSYELKESWILDSGANSHVCNDPTRFKFDRKAGKSDTLISGKTVYQIEAFGTVEITVQGPNGPKPIDLINVALVPGFFTNIASLNRFTSKGVHWDTQGSHLHKDGKTFCTVERVGGHWALEHRALTPFSSSLSAFPVGTPSNAPREPISAPLERWHAVMGHPGIEPLSHLEEHTTGAKIVESTQPSKPCEACAVSKATEIVSRRIAKTPAADEPMARVAFDLIQMKPAYNNNQWISHFRDYYTKMDFVYTHHTKGQATAIIENFLNLMKTQYQLIPRHFRTDGETSLGKKFGNLMASKGILTERSAPYTPAQNGAAERSGGVIVTKARCLRNGALLPASLWPEIVRTAAYLHNRTPRKALGWKTPYEALTKQKPDLSHLHVFGCRSYPHIKNIPRKDKLEPRAHLGYLVGYDSTNIYRIWVPSIERVLRTRDVTFDESKLYDPHDLDIGFALREEINKVIEVMDTPDEQAVEYEIDDEIEDLDTTVVIELTASSDNSQAKEKAVATGPTGYLPTPKQTPIPDSAPPPVAPASGVSSSTSSLPAASAPPISADFDVQNILPEGSTRKRKPRQQIYAAQLAKTSELSPFYAAFAAGLSIAPKEKGQHRDTLPLEPKSWKQVQYHPYSSEFKLAADREIQELTKRGTYKWVSKGTASSPPLPLLWVFKYKFDTDGYLTKFKARLCVRGDLQTTEQDTYAATLAARTFRALMAISAAFDLEAHQFDAVNAFVNSDLDEEIYCQPPEGYQRPDSTWLLLRALYGLKQSPLLWYRDFTTALEDLGLQPVPGVNCLFANDFLLLFFYVDDIVVLYHKKYTQKVKEFEDSLLRRFEMRSLGELKWFLGIRIERDRPARRLWLCQDSYISKLTAKFHVNLDGKMPRTPLFSELLAAEDSHQATAQQILAYQQRVGSLNFAAAITRPDIAHATSKLASFLRNPTAEHLAAADRTLQYLCSTRTYAIEFSGENDAQIFKCASDAAYADDPISRRSSDGFLFQLYGGAIDWRAGKQKTVTTSSTEAELLSLSTAAREVIWWRRFFANIKFDTQQTTQIHCDNLQTIGITTKETVKLETRLRHVDIHQHWLRQEVQHGTISIKWLPTAQMPADGLTKALPAQKHATFLRQLNLVDISEKLGEKGGNEAPVDDDSAYGGTNGPKHEQE